MPQLIRNTLKPIIIDPAETMHTKLSQSEFFIFRKDLNSKDSLRNSFLILSSSALNSQAALLSQTVKKLTKLRVVFVIMDTDFDAFFDHVAELKIQALLSKIFLVDRIGQIDRVLESWMEGEQGRRFAAVRMERSKLIVKACDLAKYEVDLFSLPVFCTHSIGELKAPIIDPAGLKISWPALRLDLDFDTVHYHADPIYKVELDLAAVHSYSHFGAAIRAVRESRSLTQDLVSNATGLSTRHLSRIENSEQLLTRKLTANLAQAHGLSLDQFISEILNTCITIDDLKTKRRRAQAK